MNNRKGDTIGCRSDPTWIWGFSEALFWARGDCSASIQQVLYTVLTKQELKPNKCWIFFCTFLLQYPHGSYKFDLMLQLSPEILFFFCFVWYIFCFGAALFQHAKFMQQLMSSSTLLPSAGVWSLHWVLKKLALKIKKETQRLGLIDLMFLWIPIRTTSLPGW